MANSRREKTIKPAEKTGKELNAKRAGYIMSGAARRHLLPVALALLLVMPAERLWAVELVRDGGPVAAIVVDKDARGFLKHAATELQTYLRKSTGAELPINPPDLSNWENRVFLGSAAALADPDLADREWEEDEVYRKATDRELILTGLDDGKSVIYWSNSEVWWPKLGTLFAVYAFLRDTVGVRWLFPGEMGEEVPRLRDVVVPPFERLNRPAFHQRLIWSKSLWSQHDYWEWCYRNGTTPHLKAINAPHAYSGLVPPKTHMQDHPEYFALWEGRRLPTQLCTTNPDVLAAVVQNCRDRFDAEPRLLEVSLSPNDNPEFCQCDDCRALDIDGVDPVHDQTSVSRRVFTFVNQVARELAKTHPGKLVGCYAYWIHREAPTDLALEPNVVVHFAPHAGGVGHSWYEPEQREIDVRLLTEWRSRASAMSIHEYFGLNYAGIPRTLAWLIADELRVLRDLDIRNFTTEGFDCWAVNSFDYYAMMQLFWDPDRPVEQILAEWCQAMFGPAREPMERYVLRLKRQSEETREIELSEDFFSGECLSDLRGLMDQAQRLAPEGHYRERVDFVEGPLRLVEMTMEVIRLYREYEKTGGRDEALVARLDAASRKRTAHLESLRGTRAIDFWGFRLPKEYALASNVEAFLRTGQASFRLMVRRTDTPPKVDGRLDDPCWKKAFRAGDFVELRKGGAMDPRTDVWLTYDDEHLYAGLRCHTPEAANLRDRATARDGRVWADNDVELFLQPPGSAVFYQLICNSSGTAFDARYVDDNQDVSWDPDWGRQASIGDGYWDVEIQLPWRVLGVPAPEAGETWKGNVARHHVLGKTETYSSWRPVLEGSFVEGRNLGNVQFLEAPTDSLLPNAGFEANDSGVPEGWASERNDVTRPTVTSEASAVGLRSARMWMEEPGMGIRQGMYSRRIVAEGGEPYVLSYFCRVEGGRDPLQMGGENGWNAMTGEVVWLDAEGQSLRRDWLTASNLRRGVWQEKTWEFTSPEGTERVVVNLIIRNHTGTTWVDEVHLRRADQQPAPR